MDAEPTLADDEDRLAEIAAELASMLRERVPGWLRRRAESIVPGIDPGRLEATLAATMEALGPELDRILSADVDAGAGTPLAAVRAATGDVTRLLVDCGAAVPARDAFDARAFPDDLFALGPAAFADIDPGLHEPGLRWGAARAHVHLRRRRELDR